ncbi:DUF5994 family protein [Streptomyces sp. NPDC001307]|uniref:DUF5994 family protein n=1 Tax=Streptomyces sp. NPDC001307 TaxID=3364560 RepID=UPI0036AC0D11
MEPSGTPTEAHTLTPVGGHGPLDGARWPRCDALKFELPPLVGSSEPDTGTTVRVMVDPADRPGAPHTAMAPGRRIAVEPAGPGGEAHVITVDCGTVGRRVLLLIPPEEPAPSTARPLTAAADLETPLTAARIPTRGQTRRPHGTTGNPR